MGRLFPPNITHTVWSLSHYFIIPVILQISDMAGIIFATDEDDTTLAVALREADAALPVPVDHPPPPLFVVNSVVGDRLWFEHGPVSDRVCFLVMVVDSDKLLHVLCLRHACRCPCCVALNYIAV